MRSAIFILVGAILLATAAFLYGLVVLDGATEEPAFRLVVGGTLVGAFLGLLAAALTQPSATRVARLMVIGALGGLVAGLAYGLVALEEFRSPGSDTGASGWVFLVSLFPHPWTPIALWTVFGGVGGAFIGWIAAGLARGRKPTPASWQSN